MEKRTTRNYQVGEPMALREKQGLLVPLNLPVDDWLMVDRIPIHAVESLDGKWYVDWKKVRCAEILNNKEIVNIVSEW